MPSFQTSGIAKKGAVIGALITLQLMAVTYAAEPMAEPVQKAQSRGMDFQRAVTVSFEWKPGTAHAAEEQVRQTLQAEGFDWSRTESRENANSTPKITIKATRSGKQTAQALSATILAVNQLTLRVGSSSWSISQQN